MPESTIPSTELASQYTAQVAGDLERNAKEQARVGAELAALQEQLLTLQHDHTLLANMQKALGAANTPADITPAPENTASPSPQRQAPAKSATSTRSRTKTPGTKQGGKTPAKTAAAKTSKPTLVELIRSHLTEQSGPCSAAEVTTALGQAHPDRTIKTTVVRTTLEGLVAKSQAQRSKQGSSVFYTATDTPAQAEPATAEAQPAQTGS
ncbi:hypothetical protein ACWDR3_41080 [Streptomyces sp. NPDC001002]